MSQIAECGVPSADFGVVTDAGCHKLRSARHGG